MAVPRLLATDLDGTLLGPDERISARTLRALDAATRAGISVVAATGRSHRTAAPVLAAAPWIEIAICSNGAVLYDLAQSLVVERRTIPDEVVEPLFAALLDALPGVGLAWETLAEGFDADPAFRRSSSIFDGRAPADRESAVPGRGLQDVVKVLVSHPELQGEVLAAELERHVPARCTVAASGGVFAEVTGPGVDKGAMLARLCAAWGLAASEVVAVGDQGNDLTMLAWAGTGVAMANAHAGVLDVADRSTGHHAEDGVAQLLEELIATRRRSSAPSPEGAPRGANVADDG